MTQPLVSIIMPLFNVAPFLAEAIESVRSQTYRDWELLMVDDGSTDDSARIAADHVAKDPHRVRLFYHADRANHGASATRNVALCNARGEYVAFLDGDDVWLPNKLADQVALLHTRNDVDALTGSTQFWKSWDASNSSDEIIRIGPSSGTVLHAPSLLIGILREEYAVPCTCSFIARRRVIERLGGFESSFRRVFTDQAFYAKLFLHISVLVVDDCWDRYRIHDRSSCSTASRNSELNDTRVQWLDWLHGFIGESGVRDPALDRALRVARWRTRHPRMVRQLTRLKVL